LIAIVLCNVLLERAGALALSLGCVVGMRTAFAAQVAQSGRVNEGHLSNLASLFDLLKHRVEVFSSAIAQSGKSISCNCRPRIPDELSHPRADGLLLVDAPILHVSRTFDG